MKAIKTTLISLFVILMSMMLSGCENTQVSGSMSYGMSTGYGYPMYYGSGHRHHHSDVIVVKPPRKDRARPNKPRTRPARTIRR